MTNKLKISDGQRELYPYNAYAPGLFGLHHEPSEVQGLGLDMQKYLELKHIFRTLCDRLGERALSRMDPKNAIVTPEPVSPDLARYMMGVQGYSSLPSLLDVGSAGPEEVCARILENNKLMDTLGGWVSAGATPVLTPRTYTPGSIAVAQQLGIYHAHKPPVRLPDGSYTPQIRGIIQRLNI
jgi:hypothetical protein